jgi:hypothetical protein
VLAVADLDLGTNYILTTDSDTLES